MQIQMHINSKQEHVHLKANVLFTTSFLCISDIRQQVNYFYNVSYIKPDEKILVAEFRIFKLRPHHSQMVVSAVRRAVHVIQVTLQNLHLILKY